MATAKHQEDRYANDAELIADLEEVLAIETARAGSATGEVTTVLRTLPSRTQARVPFRARHRVAMLVTLLILVLAGVGVAVWLAATRTHHGTGKLLQAAPPAAPQQVALCQSCAHDFDPLGDNKAEHPGEIGNAIDGQADTKWTTESYQNGNLGKAGVGIYLDAAPGVSARDLRVETETPGFAAQVYARNGTPPLTWPGTGWHLIGSTSRVKRRSDVKLSAAGARYRYYLLWITNLNGIDQVAINELALYK